MKKYLVEPRLGKALGANAETGIVMDANEVDDDEHVLWFVLDYDGYTRSVYSVGLHMYLKHQTRSENECEYTTK